MSQRHRDPRPDRPVIEREPKPKRVDEHRKVRRSVTRELHSLPPEELEAVALSEPHPTHPERRPHPPRTRAEPRPRRRVRHWKQRFWKRRRQLRAQRARALRRLNGD